MEKKQSVPKLFPLKSNKRRIKPIYEPYLKGNAVSALAAKRGLKLLGYAAIFMVLNLFLGTVFNFENSPFLRVVVNVGQVLIYGVILYYEGINAGDGDTAFAEIQYKHKEAGQEITRQELDRCFHPLKGFFTVLCGLLIPLILALIYAFSAKKTTYSLQSLPGWIASFSTQEEITAPLKYYQQTPSFSFVDILRVIIRTMVYPFCNLAGSRNADAMLLVDRLSPILLLLPFLAYGAGYTQGVRSRALTHGGIAQARRRKKKGQGRNDGAKKPARKPAGKELV